MIKANHKIRKALKSEKVFAYEVAKELGVHENTIFRRLRYDLSAKEEAEMLEIIKKIAKERNYANENSSTV